MYSNKIGNDYTLLLVQGVLLSDCNGVHLPSVRTETWGGYVGLEL